MYVDRLFTRLVIHIVCIVFFLSINIALLAYSCARQGSILLH